MLKFRVPSARAIAACTSARAFSDTITYVFDAVPRLPFGPDYCVLPSHTVIMPDQAQAIIRMELACNHHVVCYCAMLDYAQTQAAINSVPAGEANSISCILGPETGKDSVAKIILSELQI